MRFREPRLPLHVLARAVRGVGSVGALSGAGGDSCLPWPRRAEARFTSRKSFRPGRGGTLAAEMQPTAGDEVAATYLITAVGCISAASVPPLPGLKDFR